MEQTYASGGSNPSNKDDSAINLWGCDDGDEPRRSRGSSDPTTVRGRNHVPVVITPEQREESRHRRS